MEGITVPPKAGARPAVPPTSVIVTLSGANSSLDWLSAWREQLAGLEVLIVAADGSAPNVVLPAGFEGAKLVAPPAPAASKLSTKDLALLQAKSPRVLFLSEGVAPAITPKGQVVQVVQEHSYNLSTNATPTFFNTLYDPFRTGADFVRGYPFSLRDGIKTGVSNGLSLGSLDTATQVPNARYVDATLTVPKEAWTIFSTHNLAVDKALAGIGTYNGVDASGKPVPAEVDNTWSSLSIKVLANHLGFGCKTGLPYVVSSKPGARSVDAASDLPSVRWQKEILAFFQGVKLSATSTTPVLAYLELAALVKQQLGAVDKYFVLQAEAMEAWAQAFKAAATA